MPGRPTRACFPRTQTARLVTVLLSLLLVGWGSPAVAHTELDSAQPATGVRLKRAPSTLVLSFTDSISEEFAQLSLSRSGSPAQALRPDVRGARVSASVPEANSSASGLVGWEVTYRVVSADGHPITGSVRFTAPVSGAPQSPETSSSSDAESRPESRAAPDAAPAATGSPDQTGDAPLALLALAALALAMAVVSGVLVVRRVLRPRRD